MRTVLIVAFNFPPMAGTSAAQRTLALCRYLPAHGWRPVVLCPRPYAYPHRDPDQLKKVPDDIIVARSMALDATRHLAIGGRHLPLLDIPDRWSTWWLSAVPKALQLVRRYKPDVLLSSFPLATAHLIALTLHRLTGVLWVADFRDVMVEDDYPSEKKRRRIWQWIERRSIAASACAVFTTPGAVRLYAARYPERSEQQWAEIGNAFDEGDFVTAERQVASVADSTDGRPLRLVHSGILYPHERDPRALFEALGKLVEAGEVGPDRLRIVLRGARYDSCCRELIERHRLHDLVTIEPVAPYAEALREMLEADGLLLLQGSVCNNQIPAKVYEYLRARRPILALTDRTGDTAAVLRAAGIDTIAPLDRSDAIVEILPRFLDSISKGAAPVGRDDVIRSHTREARTARFAQLFDDVLSQGKEGRARS